MNQLLSIVKYLAIFWTIVCFLALCVTVLAAWEYERNKLRQLFDQMHGIKRTYRIGTWLLLMLIGLSVWIAIALGT